MPETIFIKLQINLAESIAISFEEFSFARIEFVCAIILPSVWPLIQRSLYFLPLWEKSLFFSFYIFSLLCNFSNLAERSIHTGNGRSVCSHNRRLRGFSICRHTSGNTFSFLVSLRVADEVLPHHPDQSVAKSQTESNFLASGGCRRNCRRSFLLPLSRYLFIHLIDGNTRPLSSYAF